MRDINHVVLTGRLTRDPETRQAGSSEVCTLGLAVNESYKDGDEWKERASFFDVSVWGGRGASCQRYLAKGSAVTVSGRLRQERWETPEGDKRSKVTITADDVMFHAKPGGDDDIPF